MQYKLIPIVIGGGYNGYGIVRSFGDENIKSIVITSGEKSFLKFSKYVLKYIVMSNVNNNENLFIEELFKLGVELNSNGKRGILFPTHDEHVIAIAKNKLKLEKYFDIPYSNWDTCEKIMDKKNFSKTCESLDIPIIKEKLVKNFTDGIEVLKKVRLPLIIKGNIWNIELIKIFGDKNKIVYTEKELNDYLTKYFEYCPSGELLIQEYIEDSNILMPNINCLSDKEGKLIAVHFGEKIRQYPPKTGTSTAFRCVDYKKNNDMHIIEEYAKRIIKHFKFYGLSGIEFKYDPKDCKYKIIEMNIRSEFTNYLQVCGGQNMPMYLYKEYLDEEYDIPYNTVESDYTIFVPLRDRLNSLHLNKINFPDFTMSRKEWKKSLGKKTSKYGMTIVDIKAYLYEYYRLVLTNINLYIRLKFDIPKNIETGKFIKQKIKGENK